MKIFVSIALSTFLHALGIGGVIFFISSSPKPSLVQTGDGSVEMEFVVRGGGEQQILLTSEGRGQAFTGLCSPVGIVPERGQAQSNPSQSPLSVRGAWGVMDMSLIPVASESDVFFETQKNAPFSSHPDPNVKDQTLEEEQIQNQKKKEIQNHEKQNNKSQAQSYVVPLPQVSGAWVLLDEKEGLYPPPRYPRIAILNAWEGETVVQLEIDNTGKVADIRIIRSSGYSVLDEAVIKTLKTWNFEKGNKRVLQVPVRFVLKRS